MKGPSRKDEPQPKCGTLLGYSKDFGKIRSKSPQIALSFDEAKASCKARKRKERQESISSLGGQERKVIRSNSEERPLTKRYFENKNIRRVSSSEDFQKGDKTVTFDRSETKKRDELVALYDEESEHERRRSHERSSKPLLLKTKISHKSRKPKARMLPKTKFKPEMSHDAKVEDDAQAKVEAAQEKEEEKKERSPSPLNIDLTTLHEQVDFSEPLLSCANHEIDENTETMPGLSVATNRLLSSPRNSIIATHRIYLDPDVQQAANFALDSEAHHPDAAAALHKLIKEKNATKKDIRRMEAEHEAKNGHKLSHFDKLKDKTIRQMYAKLNKLKKELKLAKEKCPGVQVQVQPQPQPVNPSGRSLQDTLNDIERRLAQKREAASRPSDPAEMTGEQLNEEKTDLQKALLYLESVHGRPDTKDGRDRVRPMYDKYRALKRTIIRVQAEAAAKRALPPINEDETMSFGPAEEPPSATAAAATASAEGSGADSSDDENFAAMSKAELLEQLRQVTEEKKELRRRVKVFEMDVQTRTGRMVQREDRAPMEGVYAEYKQVKAKLKLLEALVGKQP